MAALDYCFLYWMVLVKRKNTFNYPGHSRKVGYPQFLNSMGNLENSSSLTCVFFLRSPPSLSELTPMIFNTGLTHLGLEASL